MVYFTCTCLDELCGVRCCILSCCGSLSPLKLSSTKFLPIDYTWLSYTFGTNFRFTVHKSWLTVHFKLTLVHFGIRDDLKQTVRRHLPATIPQRLNLSAPLTEVTFGTEAIPSSSFLQQADLFVDWQFPLSLWYIFPIYGSCYPWCWSCCNVT